MWLFFFPLSCWGFFRLSFIFFPFQRRVYFCCVLKTFVRCEAVTWLPGWGGVSKPNELLYKPGSAWRLATCLGELSQGAAIFWEEKFPPLPLSFTIHISMGALFAQHLFLTHTNQLQNLSNAKNGLFIFIHALVRIFALIKWNMCLMSLFNS